MMTFFKEFNERTKSISKNVPIQVTLEPLNDRYQYLKKMLQKIEYIKIC